MLVVFLKLQIQLIIADEWLIEYYHFKWDKGHFQSLKSLFPHHGPFGVDILLLILFLIHRGQLIILLNRPLISHLSGLLLLPVDIEQPVQSPDEKQQIYLRVIKQKDTNAATMTLNLVSDLLGIWNS